jgi:hypothetical protein
MQIYNNGSTNNGASNDRPNGAKLSDIAEPTTKAISRLSEGRSAGNRKIG